MKLENRNNKKVIRKAPKKKISGNKIVVAIVIGMFFVVATVFRGIAQLIKLWKEG
jgi:hypothetical protein